MGRPPITYGIWSAMVNEAGSVEALAEVVGLSRQHLHQIVTGLRNLPGPAGRLAEAFARDRGVVARLYIHPRLKGHYLVSAADGWWALAAGMVWEDRLPTTRLEWEDWGHLSQIELPFVHLGEILRRHSKSV